MKARASEVGARVSVTAGWCIGVQTRAGEGRVRVREGGAG